MPDHPNPKLVHVGGAPYFVTGVAQCDYEPINQSRCMRSATHSVAHDSGVRASVCDEHLPRYTTHGFRDADAELALTIEVLFGFRPVIEHDADGTVRAHRPQEG